MTAALERYEKLGIGESLPRIHQYPLACREISIILRGAYSKLPKSLQSLVFQHTLAAFRLLPLLWNSAASDNHLWHLQHVMYFGDSNNCSKAKGLQRYGILENVEHMQLQMEVNAGTNTDWRDTFKKACKGNSLKKLTSYRGYCGHCDAVVWLSNMKCSNKHCRLNSKNQQIKPISPEQIVEYILHGSPSMISSSDSDSGDSDSDTESFRKLWAIPKHFSGCHR